MAEAVFCVGIAVAIPLVTLLAVTVYDGRIRVWPTPGPETWQNLTFWTLFRALNVSTIVLAIVDRETFIFGRWTRNPQYATVIPAYVGLAITANSGYTYVLTIALTATYVLMALAEEPWLTQAYGSAYTGYRRRVPRFYNWKHAFDGLASWVGAVVHTWRREHGRRSRTSVW